VAFGYSDKNKKSRLSSNFFLIRIGIFFIIYNGIISFLREFTRILIILIFLRIARIFVLNSGIISIASVRIRKSINIFSVTWSRTLGDGVGGPYPIKLDTQAKASPKGQTSIDLEYHSFRISIKYPNNLIATLKIHQSVIKSLASIFERLTGFKKIKLS
jgi:hypothetical protein